MERIWFHVACCAAGLAPLHAEEAQVPPVGAVLVLGQQDLSVFEDPDSYKDIACTMVRSQPSLDFDLRFHTGFAVTFPLRELSGLGASTVAVAFRITPENGTAKYYSRHFRTPAVVEHAGGRVRVVGNIDVGPGKYRVDWLLRDARQRVCSAHWEVQAKVSGSYPEAALALGPGEVEPPETELFEPQPRAAAGPLRVRILVNLGADEDTPAVVGILRSIAREPRIGHVSLVAFNLEDERILYRQADASQIDFPALGEAVRARPSGTIDFRQLGDKNSVAEILRQLLAMDGASSEAVDAIIFTGAKAASDHGISGETMKLLGNVNCPVFYLAYNSDPAGKPWNDAIGKAVRFLRGHEYTITRPQDLWTAWRDLMSRLPRGRALLAATPLDRTSPR